jgi:hypothetical protein
MNIIKELHGLFNNAILCHYLMQIQSDYELSDDEMRSLIHSNYSKDKVEEILRDD